MSIIYFSRTRNKRASFESDVNNSRKEEREREKKGKNEKETPINPRKVVRSQRYPSPNHDPSFIFATFLLASTPTRFPSRRSSRIHGGDGAPPQFIIRSPIHHPSLDQFLPSPSLGYSFSLFSAADRDWSTCLSDARVAGTRGDSLRVKEMAANKTIPLGVSPREAWK